MEVGGLHTHGILYVLVMPAADKGRSNLDECCASLSPLV